MKKSTAAERIEFHIQPSTFTPPAHQPAKKKNLPLQPFVDETQHEYEYSHVRNKLLTLSGKKETISITRGTLLVAQSVEALRYKPEDRGFDSRWCHWNFSLT